MSNFTVFKINHLAKCIDKFMPGGLDYITPIKFEALTPDIFLFLFRTSGKDGNEYFFVSYETDHILSLEDAQSTVENWHGEFYEFMPRAELNLANDEANGDNFKAETEGPYFAMLARVGKPKSPGYWADKVTIRPGDSINEKLQTFDDKVRTMIGEQVSATLSNRPDDYSENVASTFLASRTNAVVNGINKTNIAISIYMKPDGSYELFSNTVD